MKTVRGRWERGGGVPGKGQAEGGWSEGGTSAEVGTDRERVIWTGP